MFHTDAEHWARLRKHMGEPIYGPVIVAGDTVAWLLGQPDQWACGEIEDIEISLDPNDDMITIRYLDMMEEDLRWYEGRKAYMKRSELGAIVIARKMWDDESKHAESALRLRHRRELMALQLRAIQTKERTENVDSKL